MANQLSIENNLAWLEKQFKHEIEPKIKTHHPLTPDEVDLLMEYHEMKDNLEMAEAVEKAEEASYESGMDAGADQAWDEVKREIEEQLSDVIDKFGDTKVACIAIIHALVEDIVWLKIQHSLDPDEHNHVSSVREEMKEIGADDDRTLDFIEEVNKPMFDEFRADIQFGDIEHGFHQVF